MKKFCILATMVVVAFVANSVLVGTVDGRNEYLKQFQVHYKDSKVADVVKKERCNTCHFGKSKKNRNDYGQALSKHLTKELRKKLLKDKEAFNKEIDDALVKVETLQSASGDSFGKMIEDGKLPGTAPPEEASE